MNSIDSSSSSAVTVDSSSFEISVFPLAGTVFFPRTNAPLNIFEPRYIEMVNTALGSGGLIALSPINPLDLSPHSQRRLIVGAGEPLLLHRREDSSMLILLQGRCKVELNHVVRSSPYLRAEARFVVDNSHLSEANVAKMERLSRALKTWIQQNIGESQQYQSLIGDFSDPERVVECIATLLLDKPSVQQMVLEMNDINDRIELLEPMLCKDGLRAHSALLDLN